LPIHHILIFSFISRVKRSKLTHNIFIILYHHHHLPLNISYILMKTTRPYWPWTVPSSKTNYPRSLASLGC